MFSFLIEDKDNNKEINDIEFNLPIFYLERKHRLKENIKTDLELVDLSNGTLYDNILSSKNALSTKLVKKWSEYYTDDIEFLKDNQEFIKNYKPLNGKSISKRENIENIEKIIKEIDNETGFYEKYKYIDIQFLKNFNKSASVLQMLTLYNLTSPVLSLIVPIIMLLMPFLILKIQQIPISLTTYVESILKLFKNHIIGQLFSRFSQVDMSQKIFIIFSFSFYLFSIYQNIQSCYKFYKNIYKIQNYLLDIGNFIDDSIQNIENIEKYSKKSFAHFTEKNNKVKNILVNFKLDLEKIDLDKLKITHITRIGNILKCFYDINTNNYYKNAIKYSIDIHYYLVNIENIKDKIEKEQLNYCRFTNKSTLFIDGYFASLIDKSPIKNSYKLDKQILITGPNAAGKTTLLKTTLFNIILSQQLGLGCYKKAQINPYSYIHCYINIPDTSQRDSLFQAEARRCKEILDNLVNTERKERHFCIFDEIYSGTNPSEAIASAFSFLDHISNYNIDYILTTHYELLCKLLDNNKKIVNNHMKVEENKNTYKLKKGISCIKGGIKVLEELEYDKDIIDNAKKLMEKIRI